MFLTKSGGMIASIDARADELAPSIYSVVLISDVLNVPLGSTTLITWNNQQKHLVHIIQGCPYSVYNKLIHQIP